MRIICYTIICEEGITPLEEEVNEHLLAGWQPLGRPYVAKSGMNYQAMVEYEQEEKKI